jgi:hypothetical protein
MIDLYRATISSSQRTLLGLGFSLGTLDPLMVLITIVLTFLFCKGLIKLVQTLWIFNEAYKVLLDHHLQKLRTKRPWSWTLNPKPEWNISAKHLQRRGGWWGSSLGSAIWKVWFRTGIYLPSHQAVYTQTDYCEILSCTLTLTGS